MEIKNFEKFRIGGDKVFAQVRALDHSEYAFMIQASTQICKKIQVREKEGVIATFYFEIDDIKIPDWWEDSNLLFESIRPE
ncbi:hypothetical protein [Exiguobacterium sp. S22-S28]|uniref:hypothetical protein n=1 Tax=Exiguobacterium sp. S22-S28 TaxID=3342768 RepID=UPI00372D187C